MIRNPREDCLRAVELLKGDDEGEFVLKGHGAERPEEIGFFAHAGMVTVRTADQNGAGLARVEGDFFHFGGEGPAGEDFAAFIEDQPETIVAQCQQPFAFAGGVGGFDVFRLKRRETFEPREVFRRAVAGVGEAGFADNDEAPAQGRIRWRAGPD